MSKIRVHDMAGEFGISADEVIALLRQMDVPVRSHLSLLTDDQVSRVRARWEREKRLRVEKAQPVAAPASTRRRRVGAAVPNALHEAEPATGPAPAVRRRRAADVKAQEEAAQAEGADSLVEAVSEPAQDETPSGDRSAMTSTIDGITEAASPVDPAPDMVDAGTPADVTAAEGASDVSHKNVTRVRKPAKQASIEESPEDGVGPVAAAVSSEAMTEPFAASVIPSDVPESVAGDSAVPVEESDTESASQAVGLAVGASAAPAGEPLPETPGAVAPLSVPDIVAEVSSVTPPVVSLPPNRPRPRPVVPGAPRIRPVASASPSQGTARPVASAAPGGGPQQGQRRDDRRGQAPAAGQQATSSNAGARRGDGARWIRKQYRPTSPRP